MQTWNGLPVIDDNTPGDHFHIVPPDGYGRGLDYGAAGMGFGAVAVPFPQELIIPQEEWADRIADEERNKTSLPDLLDQAGWKPKDQANTNYCWVNAPTFCVETVRVLQGEAPVVLAPASVGGPLTNYANANGDPAGVGGYGKGALDYIATHGIVPVSMWPANAIDPKYATADARAAALHYRQDKWFQLDGSLEQMISCLLRKMPIAVGLGWWRHEVTYIKAVMVNGQIGTMLENSWGLKYGTAGRSVLQGRRLYPDDACAAVTALAA